MRTLLAALLFAATWLLWSGIFTPILLTLGVVSCILVTVLARRIGLFDLELHTLQLIPRLPRYLLWLLKELVKTNLTVARIVLSPRMPIEPILITVDAQDLPAASQVIVAYSITLTPGSMPTAINRGMIEVHCLTHEMADVLREGGMIRRVHRLIGS